MEKNIVRFHVSMHNIVFIKNLKRIKKLLKNKQSFRLSEFFFLSQEVLKSATIAILINKIEVVVCFQHIVVTDDMLIGFDAAQNVYLIYSTLLQLFVLSKTRYWNHFYCVLFFISVIDCTIYFAVDSRADDFVECIILYVLHHVF